MTTEDSRSNAILAWLNHDLQLAIGQMTSASGDASFRRYFRIKLAQGTRIVMDAPPAKENTEAFIKVAKLFAAVSLNVPEIYQQNLHQGFLLLEDFGTKSYLDALTTETVDALYHDALNSLYILQSQVDINSCHLPAYDAELLGRELTIFDEWFVAGLCAHQLTQAEQSMLQRISTILIESALQQPTVCVHRDFHSRNLMILENHNPGIIDFQDAVVGPVSYDLVSLLRDCYIAWPTQKITKWLDDYHQRLLAAEIITCNRDTFQRWFDLMGLQRHLKAIGIFARLKLRDNKSGYLQDIPRTLRYVIDVCQRYPELSELQHFLTTQLPPYSGSDS